VNAAGKTIIDKKFRRPPSFVPIPAVAAGTGRKPCGARGTEIIRKAFERRG
jgi:hypothetical protein